MARSPQRVAGARISIGLRRPRRHRGPWTACARAPCRARARTAIGDLHPRRDRGTEALGWTPWVITEAIGGDSGSVPLERIVTTPPTLPLVDKVAVRLAAVWTGESSWERSARRYLGAFALAPPGILHAHFGWAGAHSLLAARRLGLPLIVSFHGTDLTVSPRDPVWREPYSTMLRQATSVTVVSRFLEGRLRELGTGVRSR